MKPSLAGAWLDRVKAWLASYLQSANLLQLLTIGIVFVVLLVVILAYPPAYYNWRFFGIVAALASLLALNIVWANPYSPEPMKETALQDWICLAISAGLVLVTIWLSGSFEVTYLLSMVVAQAGGRRGVWPGGAAFGAANLAAWFALQVALGTPPTTILSFEFSLATGMIFVLLVVTLVKRYSLQTRRAETLLKELQAAQAQLEAAHHREKDLAVAEERLRLARDIHDGLGHHLIALIVQLQAAGKLLERDARSAAEAIQVCRDEAQVALEEVRQSVSALRQPPMEGRPLPEALSALAARFGELTGLQAVFETRGEVVELLPLMSETLFRAAQEGLTNAQKHARGAQHVRVCLNYAGQEVRLSVRDDGQGGVAGAPVQPDGYGLAGLRERAGQLGGSLRSGTLAEGGFEMEICVPRMENQTLKVSELPYGSAKRDL